jgi:hypothetical protein
LGVTRVSEAFPNEEKLHDLPLDYIEWK